MTKRLLTYGLAVVAAVLLSFGLIGCGMFPSGSCSHDYEIISSTATCTENGVTVKKCKKCGNTVETNTLAGHDYKSLEWVNPTCTEDGRYVNECKRCGQVDTIIIPKGHRFFVPIGKAIEPTCTTDGITAGSKCRDCGEIVEEQQILPKGHSLDDNLKCKYCGVIFKKYDITFDMDNGSEPITEEYTHGSKLEFPTEPTKPNHVFIGWYIGNLVCGENYTVSGAVTIVAKYTPIVNISDVEGFMAIADNPDGCYKLTADINMRGEALPVIDEFSGVLDGDGHAVIDATLTANAGDAGEAYGFIRTNNGTVKNITFRSIGYSVSSEDSKYPCGKEYKWGIVTGLNNGTIENVNVLSSTAMVAPTCLSSGTSVYFGCLAGLNKGNIIGCNVAADISNDAACKNGKDFKSYFCYGGVVGVNNGVISESSYSGAIDSQLYANVWAYGWKYYTSVRIGGIAGDNTGENAVLNKSYADVYVTTKTKSAGNYDGQHNSTVGGIVGLNSNGARIEECSALGELNAEMRNINIVGGIVGENASTARVYACHSSADVYVKTPYNYDLGYVGGFVGKNSAMIQKCYATGDVTSVNKVSAGGFVGGNMSGGTVRYSYVTGSVTADKEDKMSLGSVGYFAGQTETAAVMFECRYLSSVRVMCDGVYLEKGDGSGSNVPKVIDGGTLWTDGFLSEQFNWDTNDGWTVFNDDNPLLAWELQRGHNFESKVIEPTHEYGGFTAYHCSDCGRLYISDFTAPIDHPHQTVRTVAPTCTAQGYDVVVCAKDDCDYDGEMYVNFTPATGHSKGEDAQPVSTDVAPTCGASGVGEYVCAECGQSFTADIPATGNHTWVDVAAKAAVPCTANVCGEEGHSAYKYCSVCGLIDGKTDVTPHVDANMDNTCDMCKGYAFTTVSKNDFIQVSDAAGLAAIANDLSKNYILTKDIDLTGVEWTALGSKSEPFTGVLYGNKHSIIGLTANVDGVSGTATEGLFRYNRGRIIGVTLKGMTLNARNCDVVFGGIAAYNYGEIADCVISGDNYLQYYSQQKIVSSNNNSGRSSVYTLTAGGFVGVNGANGHVVGCKIEGKLVNKNAVYGEITLNIGSTIWSAGGALLNNIIFDTRLSVTQNVTVGGLVGMNAGEVSGCQVTGEVNVYSFADANLVQLKGKLTVKTELYAGSLVGYNTGDVTSNSAPAVSYEIPSEYKHIGVPYILTGKAYELTYQIVNHGSDGNGKIGVDASV